MAEVPYRLTRVGTVMVPDQGRAEEAEGVDLASGYRPMVGWTHCPASLPKAPLPRRICPGAARPGVWFLVDAAGCPRAGRGVEHGADHGGVEDPRVYSGPDLGIHIITHRGLWSDGAVVGAGQRRTFARGDELLGPVLFGNEPELVLHFNLFPDKDAVFFPEPVPGPMGTLLGDAALADVGLGVDSRGRGHVLPVGLDDRDQASGSPTSSRGRGRQGRSRLVRLSGHRLVALSQHGHEDIERSARSSPPRRVPEGWLLLGSPRVGEIAPRVRAGAVSGVDLRRRDGSLSADDPASFLGADLAAAHVSRPPRRAGRHGVERRLPHVHRGDLGGDIRVLRDGGRPDRRRSPGPGGLRTCAGEGQPVAAFTVATWAMPGPRTCTGVGPAAMNTASP